jgi:tripartite-type tricarboxylate transporter receptor subunit TctC
MIRFLMTFLASALLTPTAAHSNPDYPNKPVRIIVNVAPGGGVDTATRIIADKLRARLGQPFVVENRPGAGGNIGAEVCSSRKATATPCWHLRQRRSRSTAGCARSSTSIRPDSSRSR